MPPRVGAVLEHGQAHTGPRRWWGRRRSHHDPPREEAFVVGPEGGIAPEELGVLVDAGALPCRLGPHVLRTSTAGVAAISVLSAAACTQ